MLTKSPKILSSFRTNGYFLAQSVFPIKEMAACKLEAKLLIEKQTGPSGVFVWMYDNIPPLFESISCDPRLLSILKTLIGSKIEFLSAKPVFKSSEVYFASPWHQDQAYWGGATKYSCWIALEDTTPQNGCLRVIPGSHQKYRNHSAVEDVNGFTNRITNNDLKTETILDIPMKCGDVLVFHDQLLHSSYANSSGKDRWSFIPTYRNADIPDTSTVWSMSKLINFNREQPE